jgi:hypothetical protein
VNQQISQLSATHYLFWREPHILAQLESQFHPLWRKLVAKYMEGVSPPPEGAEHRAEKVLVGVGNSASLWGKPGIVQPWRTTEQAETDSLTKRKAHL